MRRSTFYSQWGLLAGLLFVALWPDDGQFMLLLPW